MENQSLPQINLNEREKVITFQENDITNRLLQIYQSKFWVGAVQDFDSYKNGVKAVKQLNELIKGLMALKASSPIDTGLFGDEIKPTEKVIWNGIDVTTEVEMANALNKPNKDEKDNQKIVDYLKN